MHIRKLELHGFKSFPDRTVFHFSSGISGVVGPNGCGKSNVVDAVRWCLGEQRAKQLRGQAMQDIIFAGSAERDPMQFAEVTLHFEATDEPFPGDYARLDELQVTRRLNREGNSEYLINHQKVRLRDIQEVFLDSGAANPLYSFIEQGRIGQIVRAKPEERRSLIEEAAGISRYKLKRKETEQRLGDTQENLDRVADVVAGHADRLKKLEKQVAKALKHRRLKTTIRQGEVFLGLAKFAGLADDRRALSHQGREAHADEAAKRRAVERAVQGQAALRTKLRKIEDEVAIVRERRSELEASRRERVTARDHQATERSGLMDRLRALDVRSESTRADQQVAKEEHALATAQLAEVEEALTTEDALSTSGRDELRELEGSLRERRRRVDQARQKSMDLAGRRARAEATAAGSAGRVKDISERRVRLEAQLAETGTDVTELQQAVDTLTTSEVEATAAAAEARKTAMELQKALAEVDAERTELQKARRTAERTASERERATTRVQARLESLQALHDARGEVGEGARRLLGRPGVHGVLAELLDVPAEVESSLMMLLGPRLDALVVDHASLASVLSVSIDERVPLLVVPPEDAQLDALPEALAGLGGDARGLRALQGVLGGASFSSDVDAAWLAAGASSSTVGLRGLDGGPAVVRADQVVEMGRSGAAGAEVLRRKRELAELETRVQEARAEDEAASQAVVAARAALDAVEGRRSEAENALREARKRSGERDVELGAVRRRLADQKRLAEREAGRATRLTGELERLAREVVAEQGKHDASVASLTSLVAETERVEVELQAEQQQLRTQAGQVDKRKRALAEVNARLAGLRERKSGLQRAVSAATSAQAGAQRLLGELAQDRERVSKRVEVLANDLDRLAMELSAIESQRDTVNAELSGHLEVQAASRKEAETAEQAVQVARDAREAAGKHRADIEQKLALVKESIRQIRQALEERHEVSVSGLLDRAERDGSVTLTADWEPVDTEAADTTPPDDLRVTRGMLDDEALLEEWTTKVEKAKRALARLGAVNLVALKEYEEVAEAHRELEAQRSDLERSVRAIRRTLAQLNRVSRERFRETYERVDQIFREMYPRLVGGGKARLGLTNEDDLLETGIEVFVQPPGKRSQVLTLLSGGETAMVAIALIFSLFKVKPSPFCLLDEVDAPLDEVNGARFNTVLAEMSDLSQFIVITHNKKTMEAVDTLYGVTMTSPGVSRLVTVSLDSDQPGSTPPSR